MSRIAKLPVEVPKGVEVKIGAENLIEVKGPNGSLTQKFHPIVKITEEDGHIHFKIDEETKLAKTNAGTARSLINSMVIGVSKGFEKKLELLGVGYRAKVQGKKVNLTLGFSHPIDHELPEGVTAETPSQTEIVLKSHNKQLLGQVAADIRGYRPPEPYKGKGVRYADEVVKRKEAKKK